MLLNSKHEFCESLTLPIVVAVPSEFAATRPLPSTSSRAKGMLATASPALQFRVSPHGSMRSCHTLRLIVGKCY